MQNKKIIVTPPDNFSKVSPYLDYISKMVAGTNISIQLLKALPVIINDGNPTAIFKSKKSI